MTLSPFLKSLTEAPTATTWPQPSWEAVHGSLVEKLPALTIPSVWQSEATLTFKSRSCSDREVGVGMVLKA